MFATFRERSPITVIWLFFLSIAVHSHFFFDPPVVAAAEEDGLISLFLNKYVAGLHPTFIMGIFLLLVLVQALRINFLFNDQRMFSKPSFLTAMTYILLTGMFEEWSNVTPALVINLLVIWLYSMCTRMYGAQNPKSLLFNIGLVIGVCIILYHPSTLLVLVAMFALLIVRPFNITEWIVLLMGVVSPFYFLFSFLYLTDRLQRLEQYVPEWQLNLPGVQSPLMFAITIGVIIICLLIGIYYWQIASRRMLIHIRKNWAVLTVMLLVMIPLPFVIKNAALDSLLLWIIPVSPFIAKGFLSPKRRTLPGIMFWVLFLLGLFNTWEALKNYNSF
ncbi:hypothetical protein [Aridibaculum aurantiacum]|uniref:hypothetical protein n=1 Tax=Aridibaculum aurantiacum TaxID=2810307 RepID=UPI001A95EE1D|nr:hypothetical protein [Aridibaculum aurantiacum]